MKTFEQLLEKRLFWLERFLHISKSMLNRLPGEPSASELELFDQNRNALLTTIKRLDGEIAECVKKNFTEPSQIPSFLRERIHFYKQRKDLILKEIEMADEELFLRLQTVHGEMARKLKALQKGKVALAKYKSHAAPEKLDKKL